MNRIIIIIILVALLGKNAGFQANHTVVTELLYFPLSDISSSKMPPKVKKKKKCQGLQEWLKRLRIFLLSPGLDASPSQGYPQH